MPSSSIDPEAFERLYRELAPRLVNYLLANACERALAADIVQEAFLRLWKRRDTLINDQAQLSGLAYTMVRNLRTDNWRRTQREKLVEVLPDVPAPATEMPCDIEYLRRRLTDAFAELPPLLREAYTLFQVLELPIREIALRTGTTEANVKVRIFRAKEKLRPLLKDLL